MYRINNTPKFNNYINFSSYYYNLSLPLQPLIDFLTREILKN
nr:MAG TPA: hypothetical protein [Caudoviricetes sp.]